MRLAWEGLRGYEVSTEGDSFFMAFEHAQDAILACAEVERRLASEQWAQDVRVRIGVPTGLASPRGGQYVSLAIHQAARIMAAAHGGAGASGAGG